MTKSMKAVRDRKTDNRRISQNMEKAFKKMAQVFGYPNREYKDRVFRMLLKEPKVALEVYNAMNGTSYDNPDELIITTLENAVYLGMKNDVSFILGTQLVLYEHQSTPNPNMPLRNLAYVACVYMAYVFGDNLHIYYHILHRKIHMGTEHFIFVIFHHAVQFLHLLFYNQMSHAMLVFLFLCSFK